MAKEQTKPVYLIMQWTGDIEYQRYEQALATAEREIDMHPQTKLLIVQKIATIEAHHTTKTTRNF
jgi:hypothetical protein